MSIIIGIPQMGTDLFRKYMKAHYAASIKRAGGVAKWIELDDPEKAVKEALECDGLLLPGGADVEPALYGEEKSEKCGKTNELRDTAESMIFPAFLKTGKPIFGICRGSQMLNVLCGGTLHQDISDIQKCSHTAYLKKSFSAHKVTVKKGTRLHEILGKDEIGVNSLHHQAVKDVGETLVAAAVSSDGIIEAVEMPEHPFCLAVQWHPEFLSIKSKLHQSLFNAFISACKAQKQ